MRATSGESKAQGHLPHMLQKKETELPDWTQPGWKVLLHTRITSLRMKSFLVGTGVLLLKRKTSRSEKLQIFASWDWIEVGLSFTPSREQTKHCNYYLSFSYKRLRRARRHSIFCQGVLTRPQAPGSLPSLQAAWLHMVK